MGPRLLEVKNLVTEFRMEDETVRAVNGISFTLHKGEILGIVGESGTGKSVTALSVMRLIKSPPGKITDGQMIYHSKKFGAVDLVSMPEE
ncbi:MAG: ATP-binding cassette domain-containing protein, partial [Bacteroidota bacterium]